MSHEEIIRAWKDAAYRERLTDEQRALLPEHPAGLIELTDEDLDGVAGGIDDLGTCSQPCSCHHCFAAQ